MQFLKILFWCLIAFVAALFTIGNWKWVTIQLFGNLVAEVNLPLLLLATFLAGFLPTFLYYKATRWRLRQRLTAAERTLGDIRVAGAPAEPAPPATPARPPSPKPAPSPVSVTTPESPATPAEGRLL